MSFNSTMLSPVNGSKPTKKFSLKAGALSKDSYPLIKYWDHGNHYSDDIYDLHRSLIEFADEPLITIRGTAKEGLPKTNVRRTSENFPDQGTALLMLDIDDVELPENLDVTTYQAVSYFIKNFLPEEFHNIVCVASFSASAGIIDPFTKMPIKKGLCVHLFFELSTALYNSQIKDWLRPYPVDLAIYTSVQPHYIANPIISDGIECNVEERHLLIAGAETVVQVPPETLVQVYQKILKTPSRTRNSRNTINNEWIDHLCGLPSPENMMACEFMRDFASNNLNIDHRYQHARAFANNAYRTSGDSLNLVIEGLNNTDTGDYQHTDTIVDGLENSKPLTCQHIIESGYPCSNYKQFTKGCAHGYSIRTPYSLALKLHKGGK
ncbi:hypothetical protein [Cycloclasticus pugetii]|uniref:hypothetical protein n=1 Tax=Cycloclasticus pugetii TaxID=34068 RepID=UPI00091ED02B|nr:hypothetical protein [Cycloclasticus pugetii]SHJ32410.1 hypothetical protein SAMN05519226_1862 [Cycloclasticus pugetii]